jgi:hypothetical protein
MEDYTGLFHLDSNVIDDRCVNTPSSFKNYLSSTYRYNHESFEAALLEIHIPFTWINVKKEQYIILLDAESRGLLRNGVIPITAGYYADIDDLIEHCNARIAEVFYAGRETDYFPDGKIPDAIDYDYRLQRIVTQVPLGNGTADLGGLWTIDKRKVDSVVAMFSNQLATILGYTKYCIEYLNIMNLLESTTAQMNKRKMRIIQQQPDVYMEKQLTFPHDQPMGVTTVDNNKLQFHLIAFFQSGMYEKDVMEMMQENGIAQQPPYLPVILDEMFVYCSLIKPHAIGNSYKQLLRVTPVIPTQRANRTEPIVITYDRPYYFPLYHSAFDYIEIELRDRSGQLIEFETGGVLAIVEIRRRKHAESIH